MAKNELFKWWLGKVFRKKRFYLHPTLLYSHAQLAKSKKVCKNPRVFVFFKERAERENTGVAEGLVELVIKM